MTGTLRRVVVVGGGIVGWSAAAALKRRVPALTVCVVPTDPPADALADRMPVALPSIVGFTRDLGISDADAIERTGSRARFGTRFVGWSAGGDYVHGYATHGAPIGIGAFHLHWVRAAHGVGAAPFDHYAAPGALARGRGDDALVAAIEPGLYLDPRRFGAMLRAFAEHVGVEVLAPSLCGVAVTDAGHRIDALILAEGQRVEADLFIDASGPAAVVRRALPMGWDDWSCWLPCDRLMLDDRAPGRTGDHFDQVTAHVAGWGWQAPVPGPGGRGLAYASAYLSDDGARTLLGGGAQSGPSIAIVAGAVQEPWSGNVVALGDAAVALEPLEWTNLHLAHSAIDRMIEMLPGADCAAVETREYNRQTLLEAARVRDFVALHYYAADRDAPMWRALAATPPPDSLAHTLRLFRERGRLPFFEEETFSRDSWLAVLLGQGVLPARIDALTDTVAPGEAARIMAAMRLVATPAAAHGNPPAGVRA